MTEIIDTYLKGVREAQAFLNQVHPVAGIWRGSIKHWIVEDGERKRTVRLTDGQLVKVVDGKLVDCDSVDDVNFIIVGCFGAERHSFSLKIKSISNGEETTINL